MLLSKEKMKEIVREYYETYYDVENLKIEIGKNATILIEFIQRVCGLNEKKKITLKTSDIEAILTNYLKENGYKIEEIDFYDTEELQKKHGENIGNVSMMQIPKKRIKVTNLRYEKALIVVDMVNGFVREGILHDEKISDIIPRQYSLIKENIHAGNLTIFIKDTHEMDSIEHKRFGGIPHCVKNTPECELVDELKEFENLSHVVSIEKNSTSFMEAEKMRELLKRLVKLREVNIIGCCTDICVVNGAIGLANYFDERNREVDIKVHEDAVGTYESPIHNREKYTNAAKLLMAQQGISLVRNKSI